MAPKPISVPSIYPPVAGAAHAMRFSDTVYTGAIMPKDQSGRLAVVGLAGQAKLALGNLDAVLASAGAQVEEVAKVNCYVDPSVAAAVDEFISERDAVFGRGRQAGTIAPLTMPEPGMLVAVEAIAHLGVQKTIVALGFDSDPKTGWANAVRVADALYVSGRYGVGPTFGAQAKGIYDEFDRMIHAAGASWRDMVRVHQFAVRSDLSIDQIRAARAPYLRNEEFLSTSVVCHEAPLKGVLESWQLLIDIEGTLGPKAYFSSPSAWANPGGLHIVKSGGTAYFQAQMSRDAKGVRLHPDDAEKHTVQICRNLEAMMEVAKIDRADLVHIRSFCKYRRDVATARAVVDRWIGGHPCARSEFVVDFFDPLAIVEIEVTASA
jgi:enamine deaminase RidA (YjgF/YER057c/UK114 family)